RSSAFDVRRSALAEAPLLPAGHQGVEQGSELQVGFVELLFRIRSRHDAGSCVDTGSRAADQRGAYANNKFAAAACIQPADRAGVQSSRESLQLADGRHSDLAGRTADGGGWMQGRQRIQEPEILRKLSFDRSVQVLDVGQTKQCRLPGMLELQPQRSEAAAY